MKNKIITLILVLTASAAAVFTGCATFEGPIELDKMPAETSWISPLIKDGIKDSLDVEFSIPEYQNMAISGYRIAIENAAGKTVFEQGAAAEKNKLPGLVLPSSFSWAGIDQNGKPLPDGSYFYHIEISYGSKQQFISPVYRAQVPKIHGTE